MVSDEITQVVEKIRSGEIAKLMSAADALYTEVQTAETANKSAFKSKGFWGAVGGIVMSCAGVFGIVLTTQDATTMQALTDNIWTVVTAGSAAVSSALALYGRVKAQGGLKFPWSK